MEWTRFEMATHIADSLDFYSGDLCKRILGRFFLLDALETPGWPTLLCATGVRELDGQEFWENCGFGTTIY